MFRLRPRPGGDGPSDPRSAEVIGRLSAQRRAVDFRDFLDEIDRQVDPGLAVPVICDNLSAHKAPAVHRWLLAHPRVQLLPAADATAAAERAIASARALIAGRRALRTTA